VRARLLIPLAIAAVLFGSYWIVRGSGNALAPVASESSATGKSSAGPSATANASRPGSGGGAVALPAGAAAPSLRKRFLEARDLKVLYASIDAMADIPEAERLLYKAVILESCASYAALVKSDKPGVKEMVERGGVPQLKVAPSGNASDPRVKSAADYLRDRSTVNACRGFADAAITKADVDKAYAQAAAAGSLAAQARVIAQRLVDQGTRGDLPPALSVRVDGGNNLVRPAALTAGEQQQLLNALLSGDPVAIVEAGHVLSMGSERQVLRVGNAAGDPSPYSDFEYMLAACEFGFECGSQNLIVSRLCAYRGQCADDYETLLRDYMVPPADFAVVQAEARALADAIRAGNVNAFQLVDRSGAFLRLVSEPGGVQIH